MGGRHAKPAYDFLEALGYGMLDRQALQTFGDKQTRAGRRGKGNGALQLRIIPSARSFEGIGPAVVENILALAMILEVAGEGADEFAFVRFNSRWWPIQPVCAVADPDSSSEDRKACDTKGL